MSVFDLETSNALRRALEKYLEDGRPDGLHAVIRKAREEASSLGADDVARSLRAIVDDLPGVRSADGAQRSALVGRLIEGCLDAYYST